MINTRNLKGFFAFLFGGKRMITPPSMNIFIRIFQFKIVFGQNFSN